MIRTELNGDVYCDTKEELLAQKIIAEKNGYEVKEMTDMNDKVTGRGLYCSLKEEYQFGKCGYCDAIISRVGIYGHNRICENCGEVISLRYKKGDLISFVFNKDERSRVITLRLAETPMDDYFLFENVIPKIQYRSYTNLKRKDIIEVLQEFVDDIVITKLDGKICYKIVSYINDMRIKNSPINIYETKGADGDASKSGFKKCKIVKIWNDKEYSEHAGYQHCLFDNTFPVPESFHIYREWGIEKFIL